MKVLFFNYEFPPLGGGAGNASFYLLREYAKNPEVEVDFVTASVDEEYHFLELGDGINVHRIPIGKNPSNIHYQTKKELISYSWNAYWFARKLAKKNKYDLTHSFFSVPCGFLSLLLKWEFKLPYIVSLRGSDVPYYSERFKILYKFLVPLIRLIWNQAYFVVANSKGLAELALKSKPNKKIGVIYNGIDVEEFFPCPAAHDPEEFRIICGTRVTPRKGIRILIQALDVLIKRYPQLRLIIVGEGDEKKSLQDFTKSIGLEKVIDFLGQVDPKKRIDFYSRGNIYVSPSYNEGMANFMLECMALGMPILATDVGGTKELLRDGDNGFIIKIGDHLDLAEKIEKFLLDKTLEKKMGQASLQYAKKLSWDNVANEYIDLYEKTIDSKK